MPRHMAMSLESRSSTVTLILPQKQLWSRSRSAICHAAIDISSVLTRSVLTGSAGFARSFGAKFPADPNAMADGGERREYLKPILFTGGVGQMHDAHTAKGQPQPGSASDQHPAAATTAAAGSAAALPLLAVFCCYFVRPSNMRWCGWVQRHCSAGHQAGRAGLSDWDGRRRGVERALLCEFFRRRRRRIVATAASILSSKIRHTYMQKS